MQRFQFSLETLLSLRKEKEQECEIALAMAAGELATIDGKIEEARIRSEKVFLSGGHTLQALQLRESIMNNASFVAKSLEEPRRIATGKMDVARSAYNEAHSQRAALDKLKEKKWEQWLAESKREEIKRLDEVANGAMVRKRLTGGDK